MSKYINQYNNYAAYSGDSTNFSYPHAAYLNEEKIGVYDRDNRRFCDVFGTVVDGTQEGDFGIYINGTKKDVVLDGNNFSYVSDISDTITEVKFYNVMGSVTEKIKTIDKFAINTINVTDMSDMFQLGNQYYPSNATYIDLSNLNTANVTNMNSMFNGCSNLTSLDVSGFNTSNVTDMGRMFYGCKKLQSIKGIENFNTSKVTGIGSMFNGCSNLTSLDINNWDTSKVTDMSAMFSGCSGLTSIDVSNFNTSGVTTINGIFSGCRSLTSLDLSNFNTSNVTFMREVFSGCTSLITIDISNWDTTKAAGHPSYYTYMFNNCSSLGSITMNNTSQSTLEFIQARLVDGSVASHVTIHRDGYAWTYSGGQWSSTPE